MHCRRISGLNLVNGIEQRPVDEPRSVRTDSLQAEDHVVGGKRAAVGRCLVLPFRRVRVKNISRSGYAAPAWAISLSTAMVLGLSRTRP